MSNDSLAIPLIITASNFARAAALAGHTDAASTTWRVLSLLNEQGPIRPSAIAQSERTTRATTTAIITRLEEEGLAVRRTDPADARAVLVHITDAGRTTLTNFAKRVDHVLVPHLTALSTEERTTLANAERLMRRLTKALAY